MQHKYEEEEAGIGQSILRQDMYDRLTKYDFPFENLVFEGGGVKGLSFCGALKVGTIVLIIGFELLHIDIEGRMMKGMQIHYCKTQPNMNHLENNDLDKEEPHRFRTKMYQILQQK